MSERVAIVVGAGGELGRATAEKLAAAGFTVVGTDRSENGLKELPDGIRREVANPVNPVSARSVIDRIAAEVGPPEVLVNTIGMYHLGDALTATQEDLRLMMDVNVGSALWLTQAVVPYLRERGSGSIVHVAARPGLEPTAGMVTYAVSKAALVHLTRCSARTRVNAVAPAARRRQETVPTSRRPADARGRPETVADIIVYLVSDTTARSRCGRARLQHMERVTGAETTARRVLRARRVARAPGRVRRNAAGTGSGRDDEALRVLRGRTSARRCTPIRTAWRSSARWPPAATPTARCCGSTSRTSCAGIEDNLATLGAGRLAAVNLRYPSNPASGSTPSSRHWSKAREEGLIDGIGLSNISRPHLLRAACGDRRSYACRTSSTWPTSTRGRPHRVRDTQHRVRAVLPAGPARRGAAPAARRPRAGRTSRAAGRDAGVDRARLATRPGPEHPADSGDPYPRPPRREPRRRRCPARRRGPRRADPSFSDRPGASP